MKFGVHAFVTDRSISVVELAKEVEERGFESLWLPEHTHTPTSRATPFPAGGELPEEYSRCIDPLVGMAMGAAVTSTLRLGTAVMLVAQRDPIITAKALSTLDHESNGRISVGVGYGWNREEMHDHGVSFSRRRAMGGEHVMAMQRLWADEEAEFSGDFARFEPSWMWPKPLQVRPNGDRGVPVLLGGGAGPKLFGQIVEFADGWMPIRTVGLAENVVELHRVAEDAGRDPAELEVSPFDVVPDSRVIDDLAAFGVARAIFRLPHGGRDEVLAKLDEIAESVRPHQAAGASHADS